MSKVQNTRDALSYTQAAQSPELKGNLSGDAQKTTDAYDALVKNPTSKTALDNYANAFSDLHTDWNKFSGLNSQNESDYVNDFNAALESAVNGATGGQANTSDLKSIEATLDANQKSGYEYEGGFLNGDDGSIAD